MENLRKSKVIPAMGGLVIRFDELFQKSSAFLFHWIKATFYSLNETKSFWLLLLFHSEQLQCCVRTKHQSIICIVNSAIYLVMNQKHTHKLMNEIKCNNEASSCKRLNQQLKKQILHNYRFSFDRLTTQK